MTMPVPLGVRIFNNWGHSVDVWVTSYVDDIQFRSTVPGGFASATLTLHNARSTSWTQVAQAYNRVQIVDLETQEIAWEGRIDTVRRQTGDDTWELGCLGAMVYATDIQRPMFYIDSDCSNWLPATGATAELFGTKPNNEAKKLTYAPAPAVYSAPNHLPLVYTWEKARACDLFIGRFDLSLGGSGVSALRTAIDVVNASAGRQDSVVLQNWGHAPARFARTVATNFTATNADRLEASWDTTGTSVTVASGNYDMIDTPRVQVQRVSETGAKLQTGASYPNEYLTVEQVVRDVVGRFMVGGWYVGANNTPYHGFVGSEGIYIDTTSTAQITHLTYYDGATAADILNDMMAAQPNAYWGLWESRYAASVDGNSDARFRFSWETWPAGYTYHATSIDGLEEQPDGGDLFNFVWFQHPLDTNTDYLRDQEVWTTSSENQLLTDAQLVRGVTVQATEPMSSATAFTRASSILSDYQRTTNTGTLTVRRPIMAYDLGGNSNSGISRMLDPWMIRPGKLIRITDIPPRSNGPTFGYDSIPYAPELDGTVFRVVSTEYSSADNSCRLELDQVPKWDAATQVIASGQTSSDLIVRG